MGFEPTDHDGRPISSRVQSTSSATPPKTRSVGFEPTTPGSEVRCSVQLSYERLSSTRMPREGLEPSWSKDRQILSPVRLPISPPRPNREQTTMYPRHDPNSPYRHTPPRGLEPLTIGLEGRRSIPVELRGPRDRKVAHMTQRIVSSPAPTANRLLFFDQRYVSLLLFIPNTNQIQSAPGNPRNRLRAHLNVCSVSALWQRLELVLIRHLGDAIAA